MIEPTKGNWTWENADAVMASADERGLKVLPILCYGCSYTGHNSPGVTHYVADEDMDSWCLYVTNFVTRYRSRIEAVEVWNEPDYSWFWTSTREQYAKLLKRTYTEVKAVAPEVKVVLGGLCSGNWDYLASLYGDGERPTSRLGPSPRRTASPSRGSTRRASRATRRATPTATKSPTARNGAPAPTPLTHIHTPRRRPA